MWVFFGSKCVKIVLFSIFEDYKRTDVDALTSPNRSVYLNNTTIQGFMHSHLLPQLFASQIMCLNAPSACYICSQAQTILGL